MYSLYSMIAVSTMNWHSILYLITPWQYQQRLGILFYILSSLGNICLGLAFYFISGSALAFSLAEAWHSILYLITPWHYQPRLGMLFHILSRLAVSSEAISYHHALVLAEAISCHTLVVSAEAWHAILYLNLGYKCLE